MIKQQELDLPTLRVVREKAVEFAKREWKAGHTERSDSITDFFDDIDAIDAKGLW